MLIYRFLFAPFEASFVCWHNSSLNGYTDYRVKDDDDCKAIITVLDTQWAINGGSYYRY